MKYEIVATLGPGSSVPALWKVMLAAGVDTFRLNTSHLSISQLEEWLDKLLPFCSAQEIHPCVVLDLQGSKWRIGEIEPVELDANREVEFVYGRSTDRQGAIPVPHQDFFAAIPLSSNEIVLNDAKVRIRVESFGPDWLKGRVIQGGSLSRNKGITFTSSSYRVESLTPKDQAIIEKTRALPGIRYALSYLKDAIEARRYRLLFEENAYLIAKLERPSALEDALEISALMNELWICRGDLGAEVGLKAFGEAVHSFSLNMKDYAIPVFMAGQVLEHMVDHATPTRSEICFIYEALSQGYQGLVLSDETAIGPFNIESCQVAALYKEIKVN